MARILVMADTHLDQLTPGIPDTILHEIRNCDQVIHAGDFTGEDCYRQLSSLTRLVAVHGNMDCMFLSSMLPAKLQTNIENVRIGIIHGVGSPRHTLHYARSSFQDLDLIIFGHSHQPFIERFNGVTMFNPGSTTAPRSHPFPSYGILEIKDGEFQTRIVQMKR